MAQKRHSTARSSGSLIVLRRNSVASVTPHRPSALKRAAHTADRIIGIRVPSVLSCLAISRLTRIMPLAIVVAIQFSGNQLATDLARFLRGDWPDSSTTASTGVDHHFGRSWAPTEK